MPTTTKIWHVLSTLLLSVKIYESHQDTNTKQYWKENFLFGKEKEKIF